MPGETYIDPCARTLSFIERHFFLLASVQAPMGCCTVRQVLVIDPRARTLSFIEGVEEGGLKYVGICRGPDGMPFLVMVTVISTRKKYLSYSAGDVKASWRSSRRPVAS